MKEIISSVMLSVSANLDNVIIGLTFGNRNKKIPLYYVCFICLIIALVTFLAISCGSYISDFLPQKLGNIISAITLIVIGIYSFFSIKKDCNLQNGVNNISIKTSIILAISLSLNNSIISLAGGISGVNRLITVIATFFFSSIFLVIGNALGRKINTKIIGFIASLLLILLGIFEYIY